MNSVVVACLLTLGCLVVHSPAVVKAEVFTALVHMEGLISLEKELLAGLDTYLDMERKR